MMEPNMYKQTVEEDLLQSARHVFQPDNESKHSSKTRQRDGLCSGMADLNICGTTLKSLSSNILHLIWANWRKLEFASRNRRKSQNRNEQRDTSNTIIIFFYSFLFKNIFGYIYMFDISQQFSGFLSAFWYFWPIQCFCICFSLRFQNFLIAILIGVS